MYEVVSQQLPYQERIKKFRKTGGKGMNMRMIRRISAGLLRPELDDAACSKFRIGRSFIKLFHRCVAFEPRERPEAEEVARKLEEECKKRLRLKQLLEGDADRPRSNVGSLKLQVSSGKAKAVRSAWPSTLFDTFASRLESEDERIKLSALKTEVEDMLGSSAVSATEGVWNAARLLRFLKISGLSVHDAQAQIAISADTRAECDMDAKRERILVENMSFDTIVSRGWSSTGSASCLLPNLISPAFAKPAPCHRVRQSEARE